MAGCLASAAAVWFGAWLACAAVVCASGRAWCAPACAVTLSFAGRTAWAARGACAEGAAAVLAVSTTDAATTTGAAGCVAVFVAVLSSLANLAAVELSLAPVSAGLHVDFATCCATSAACGCAATATSFAAAAASAVSVFAVAVDLTAAFGADDCVVADRLPKDCTPADGAAAFIVLSEGGTAVCGGAASLLPSASMLAKPVLGALDAAVPEEPPALAGAAAGVLAMRLAAARDATRFDPSLSASAVARAGPVRRCANSGFMSIGRVRQDALRQARTAAARQSLPRWAAPFAQTPRFSGAFVHKSMARALRAASAGQKRSREYPAR